MSHWNQPRTVRAIPFVVSRACGTVLLTRTFLHYGGVLMKVEITTTNPFADVTLEKVMVAGQEVNKRSVMIKDDLDEYRPISVVGPEYNLVPNSVCRDVMDDVMSRSEYGWRELKTFWDGKRFIQMHITRDAITSVRNGQEYPLHVGLMVRNSYDGSSAFAFEMYACNMVCSNQYINRNRFGFFAMRHTPGESGKWDVNDALQNVGVGADNLLRMAPQIQQMMGEPLTADHIINARQSIKLPDSYWSNTLDRLDEEPRTRFGLFQALTGTASHDVKGVRSLRVGDSVGTYFLN